MHHISHIYPTRHHITHSSLAECHTTAVVVHASELSRSLEQHCLVFPVSDLWTKSEVEGQHVIPPRLSLSGEWVAQIISQAGHPSQLFQDVGSGLRLVGVDAPVDVAYVVADAVVALVVDLPGDASPARGLLIADAIRLRLPLISARVHSASRDARNEERPVVTASVEGLRVMSAVEYLVVKDGDVVPVEVLVVREVPIPLGPVVLGLDHGHQGPSPELDHIPQSLPVATLPALAAFLAVPVMTEKAKLEV